MMEPEWRSLRTIFSLPREDPALASSLLAALAQRAPTLYIVILFSVMSLAETHMGLAPPVLTEYIPAVIMVAAVWRMAFWMNQRANMLNSVDAIKELRKARTGVVVLGGGCALWSFLLLPYGDGYVQSQVEMTILLTVLTCVICLIHLRSAAIFLSLIVGIPFIVLFLRSPHPPVRLAAAIGGLALFVMVQVLLRNAADFVALSLSERELQRRQKDTQRLLEEN